MSRRSVVSAASLALALGLVACPAPASDDPTASPTPTPSPSATPSPTPTPSLPVTPGPATVPPGSVEGLEVVPLEPEPVGDVTASATRPVFPGSEPFNLLLADVVTSDVHAHLAAASDQQDADPGALTIRPRVLLATPELQGVQLDRTEVAAEQTVVTTTTFYYDVADRRAVDASGLVADNDASAELARLVAAQLDATGYPIEGDATTRAALRPGGAAYRALAFTRDGDLLVQVPEGAITGLPARLVRLLVPWEDARNLVSDLGRRVRAAIVAAAAPDDDPATTVSPSAAPDGG